MKYKVVFQIDFSGGGSPDGMCVTTFFRLADAVQAAQAWSEAANHAASVWDGSQWTAY